MSQTPILVIFAGGTSSRMWPLRQKLLLRFGSEPLLLSQLRRYQAIGFEEAIIIAGEENHAEITALIGQIESLKIQVVVQQEAKGQGDAMLQIAPAIVGREQMPIYAVQVHDVTDDQLHHDMLAAFRENPAATYLAGYEMEEYFPGGYLIVDQQDRISGIIEKPGADKRPSKLVSIVAHMHQNAGALLDAIRTEYASGIASDDHYERAMDALMKQQTFKVVRYKGHWSALKFPWHVLSVMEYFLSQIKGQTLSENVFIAPTASLVGDVFLGPGVKVFPGAAVVGPAYIGAGTIIGNNSLVRQSMVLDRCEVGFTTEIARSYVAEHCSMHACRVLDSIFAPHVNFSAGCTTANLRIDRGEVQSSVKGQRISSGRSKFGAVIGEDAFLGVDVMTMPGVKIGPGAQIGPGTHVHTDVRDRQRVYVKQELIVVEG